MGRDLTFGVGVIMDVEDVLSATAGVTSLGLGASALLVGAVEGMAEGAQC